MTAAGVDDDGDEGSGLELESRIAELDAYLRPTRLWIDVGIDKRDPAAQSARGLPIRKLDRGWLTELEQAQFVFEDLPEHPQGGQVGDLERRHLRGDVLAREGVALEHDPGEGRVDRQDSLRLARPRQLLDLRVRDVPQAEAFAGRGEQRASALTRFLDRTGGQLPVGFEREQVLPLRRHQIRAVDGEERLAFLHLLTDKIHRHGLRPPRNLRVDFGDARFVVGDDTNGTDARLQCLVRHLRGSDADQLLPRRRDVDALAG